MSLADQPLQTVHWLDPSKLRGNAYNPNKVAPTELALLKTSIIEDGWTMPIVARPDADADGCHELVDGFHRWTLGRTDPEIRALTGGLVPVVFLRPRDEAHQRMSTIRHNRARGQHGILKMAEIVGDLLTRHGCSPSELQDRLGMEPEEVARLSEQRGSPAQVGGERFNAGWIPDPRVVRKG